jgi:hypothetical protein
MSKRSILQPDRNNWSEKINELSGRIYAAPENLKSGLRYALYLELKNHSLNPVAVTNQPEIEANLFTSSGKLVETTSLPISGPIPAPQTAVIPGMAYIGFRIDMQTVGIPAKEQGNVLVAVGNKIWKIGLGKYVLQSKLTFKKADNAFEYSWVGELTLRPVEIDVTAQMIETGI